MQGLYNAHFLKKKFHRDCESCFARNATQLYRRARIKGSLRMTIGWLTRRCPHLLSLQAVVKAYVPDQHLKAGVRPVPIDQVQGSEGRSRDFDRAFYPVRDHVRARWLHIASARERGEVLPPVELIRVGNIYFVRDGHHRISVAWALNEIFIDAEVVG